MGNSEVSMKEGDHVELLKMGCAGWWYVKILCKYFSSILLHTTNTILTINQLILHWIKKNTANNGAEGWAPAAFLDPIRRRTLSRCKQLQ